MTHIYLDHSATTPVFPEAWEAMRPLLTGPPGNPASAHAAGRQARRALEDARERVAELLGADADEVIFTSGATEANNLALFGLAGDPPGHIVASPIEHPCVVEPLRQLAARGFVVDYLPVGRNGVVDVGALLGIDPRLVTVMMVNHETGAIQASRERERPEDSRSQALPGNALSSRLRLVEDSSEAEPRNQPVPRQSLGTRAFAHAPGSPVHTDAAQAVGKIPVHFHDLAVTALTVSAHKFGGPPGVGALLLRRGAKLRPLFYGGHQQHGRRPGTEPVALAVGMAAALEIAVRDLEANTAHVRRLRDRLLSRLQADAAPVVVNSPSEAVPHILNVSFPECAADGLLIALDLAGVACSTGSACSSGSLLPSPVLKAMGVPEDVLRSAMRFSLGPQVTEAEIDDAAGRIVAVVKRLRAVDQELVIS